MPSPTQADVGELLRRLAAAGVEFIVVGGAAAVLHGAPITTEDLDIKTKTGRAKDRLMLPILVALAEELAGSDPTS